jgi:hypothetical protein
MALHLLYQSGIPQIPEAYRLVYACRPGGCAAGQKADGINLSLMIPEPVKDTGALFISKIPDNRTIIRAS